jgi:hypothetical protein
MLTAMPRAISAQQLPWVLTSWIRLLSSCSVHFSFLMSGLTCGMVWRRLAVARMRRDSKQTRRAPERSVRAGTDCYLAPT